MKIFNKSLQKVRLCGLISIMIHLSGAK